METSQSDHLKANVQRGQEDRVLVICTLQDENAPTYGPKHSGNFWSGHRPDGKSQTSWAHLLLPDPALAQYPGRAAPLRQLSGWV